MWQPVVHATCMPELAFAAVEVCSLPVEVSNTLHVAVLTCIPCLSPHPLPRACRPFKRARHASANGLHAGSPHRSDTSMQDAAGDSEAAASDPVEGSTPPGRNGLPADEAPEDAAPAAAQGEGWEGDDLVDRDPQDPEDEDMRSAGPTSKLGLHSGACSGQLGEVSRGTPGVLRTGHEVCWPGK